MAVLRTWAEVEAFDGGPTEAEQRLIDACREGQPCTFGPARPDDPDAKNTIRADILGYLVVGGCEKCAVDPRGVQLFGAYVTGALNLDYEVAHGATRFEQCFFDHRIATYQTHFKMFSLIGSSLPGWFGPGCHVDGSVFLRNAKFMETIDLTHSTIGGQLTLVGTQIETRGMYAINARRMKINGGLYLHPQTQEEKDKVSEPFYSIGEICLNGATLGGLYGQQTRLEATTTGQSLSLGGATVTGPVRLDGCNSTGELLLAGSRVAGRLTCERIALHNEHGHAFNGQAMHVDHSFVWKKAKLGAGAVSLNGAHVTELDDHPDNWPDRENLFLDGFTYDRIKGTVSTSPARMDWLRDGSYFGDEFRPQPYSQYAKYLRDTGHDEDARRVLYTRERKRRASTRAQLRTSGHRLAGLINLWSHFWDVLLRGVVGYGHYPFRSIFVLGALILATIIPAHFAWEEGSFAPNAAPVIVSDGWTALAASERHPSEVWSGDAVPKDSALTATEWKATAPGRDWETFNRYAYGFDVVIPIIDFGQTNAWAPSTTRGPWGWHLWWRRWVLSVMGWIVTALGAAAITGIIRRE